MSHHTMDFIDALTSDCRVLLARFEEQQSLRFEAFCEVWKQLKFSLIHHAFKAEWERIQVVECLFRIFGPYLTLNCPLQYQVGAIYSIYSVYHSQPVSPKVKIRMTLSMWKDLMILQENIKEQKGQMRAIKGDKISSEMHHDVYYVISSLRVDKAFLFVAMPIQLTCGSRDAISHYEREVAKDSKSSNTAKTAQEIIKKVNGIDKLYNSAKMKMCSPEEGTPLVDPVTLRVASSELVQNLQRDVKEFETWKKSSKDTLRVKHIHRAPELGLPDDRRNESDKQLDKQNEKPLTRLQVVKEIKDRSFKAVTKVSKGNRRHQPIPESPKNPSGRKLRKRKNKK